MRKTQFIESCGQTSAKYWSNQDELSSLAETKRFVSGSGGSGSIPPYIKLNADFQTTRHHSSQLTVHGGTGPFRFSHLFQFSAKIKIFFVRKMRALKRSLL